VNGINENATSYAEVAGALAHIAEIEKDFSYNRFGIQLIDKIQVIKDGRGKGA